ncbi:hypothetical protein ELX96_26365 [Escherichia coli]|nr:hypothetical protein ELX90_28195 [Escherichia coli]TFN51743.1 hypothetical protein ELX90_26840 [Escherichia coli]TFN56859.1 hypothetical protein ELX96_28420 [Escherichia coli]TFN60590.1 hypothetical protein ELX96_26365 [Escherichia coli]TFP90400.1 hypothetical protein ELV15_13620 [Escherichia coli]
MTCQKSHLLPFDYSLFPPVLTLITAALIIGKRLARTVLIFTERSDQLSRATDRVPGLPASPGYAQ